MDVVQILCSYIVACKRIVGLRLILLVVAHYITLLTLTVFQFVVLMAII